MAPFVVRGKNRGIRRKIAVYSAVAASTALANYHRRLAPTPWHTSIRTGQIWVEELIYGHPERIRSVLGISKEAFVCLVNDLRVYTTLDDSRGVSLEEQVALLLHFLVTNNSVDQESESFQRSPDTISHHFHRALNALTSLAFRKLYMKLPDKSTPQPSCITNNLKFSPWFDKALGAVDGTLIDAAPSETHRARYRDQKGRLSHNVLGAIDFDMHWVYFLCGWEGSAGDSSIFNEARRTDLAIPPGYFYLGDAGFGISLGVLVPYRGVRYHLREWMAAGLRPENPKELFNLQHSQARNVIERGFGHVKKRFKMFRQCTYFPIQTQVQIHLACGILDKFISIHNPQGTAMAANTSDDGAAPTDQAPEDINFNHGVSAEETAAAEAWRDEIAQGMWLDYIAHSHHRERPEDVVGMAI